MKLHITKNQSKGMMGGISFEVKARVELSEDERKLIQHYKLDGEVLLSKKMINIWGQPTDREVLVAVRHLVNGESYKCKDLSEVIGYSESLKTACETLKAYLAVASTFGGNEVVEI